MSDARNKAWEKHRDSKVYHEGTCCWDAALSEAEKYLLSKRRRYVCENGITHHEGKVVVSSDVELFYESEDFNKVSAWQRN